MQDRQRKMMKHCMGIKIMQKYLKKDNLNFLCHYSFFLPLFILK